MDLWAISLLKSKQACFFIRILLHNKWNNCFIFFSIRYYAAVKTGEFGKIDSELAHECYEYFHKFMNFLDGSDSWYETSCDMHGYVTCEGDRLLDWKDRGYATVFDLLQVFLYVHYLKICVT